MDIEELVEMYRRTDEIIKSAEIIKKQCAEEIISYGRESQELIFETANVKATIVYSETVQFDVDGLHEAIGEELWKKISKSSVDQRKLAAMIDSGEVDSQKVLPFMTTKPKQPYVRVSNKTRETTSPDMSEEWENS